MKKYWLIIKNTWNEYLEYHLNFILWRVRVVIRFLITYFLWSTVYQKDVTYFGYNRGSMLSYVFLVYIASNFILASRTQDIGSYINEGRLANDLLKPLNFFGMLGARDLSDKLLNFGFTIIETILFLQILKPPFSIQVDMGILLLAAVTFILATILYFIISLLLSFIGFWTAEVWATRFIFIILLDFVAGNFFPIDILPDIFQRILLLTPFPYLFYFPVKMLLGGFVFREIIMGMIIMIFWSATLLIFMRWVWKKGLRVYAAEGR